LGIDISASNQGLGAEQEHGARACSSNQFLVSRARAALDFDLISIGLMENRAKSKSRGEQAIFREQSKSCSYFWSCSRSLLQTYYMHSNSS